MGTLRLLLVASIAAVCGCAGRGRRGDAAGVSVSPARTTVGASSNQIVGVWRVVKFCSSDSTGRQTAPFGERPVGYVIYAPTGQLSIHVARLPGSALLASDTAGVSDEIRRNIFDHYLGYFGTYTVTSDSTVIHHVEGGSLPSYANTDQRRRYRVTGSQGDTLALGDLSPGCRVLVRERLRPPT